MTYETTYATAMLSLATHEKRLDPQGIPIPMYGVAHTDNVMKGVRYLADRGGVEWLDRTQQARVVANALGYTSVSNCAAMFREAIASGLVDASKSGWLFPTPLGFSQLDLWEENLDGW